LRTSAATPDPASSFSATTGEFGPASGVWAVSSAGTEEMRVNATGVGIGTNAPAYLLHVGSPSAVGVVADFQNSFGYCTFSPSANGILTTCTSDVRLKKDIVDTGDALAWLGTMRIRDFTLRATGERRTGVIAQEMMKVHPEMVRMGATGFYQVDVPDAWKLIKAIQELKAENEDLVTRIGAGDEALKAANDNIADLRASFEAYKEAHP
jgi:Chaperone of endosialidase